MNPETIIALGVTAAQVLATAIQSIMAHQNMTEEAKAAAVAKMTADLDIVNAQVQSVKVLNAEALSRGTQGT